MGIDNIIEFNILGKGRGRDIDLSATKTGYQGNIMAATEWCSIGSSWRNEWMDGNGRNWDPDPYQDHAGV